MFSVNRLVSRRISRLAAAALALAAAAKPLHADTPSTQPAVALSPADREAKIAQLQALAKPLLQERAGLLGDGSVLRDPSKHAEVREKLPSLIAQIDSINARFVPLFPPSTRPSPSPQEATYVKVLNSAFMQSVLVAAEDPATIAQVQALIASNNPTIAAMGHLSLLEGAWMGAPDDAGRQKAVDRITAFLKTADRNDKWVGLTVGYLFFVNKLGSDAPLRDAIVAAYPTKNIVEAAESFKRRQEATAILVGLVNKPIVLAGTTPEGKPFTTADWKGKVVLVDFWATWCGPCKASLPHVKEVYEKYHDQGLEIIGVSNDYTKDALTKFLAADPAMAWPDLFDQKSADNQEWHPLTKQFGVVTIPRMFLIDKNGICRSVEARNDMDVMIPKLLSENPVAVAN